jgi:AcrR family transcriptional regulator
MEMLNEHLRDTPNFKDQRRERIIQVARSVFFEVGYAGASMSLISQRLGGSKATLYAYFSSKEELFAAIIRGHGGDLSGPYRHQ